MFRNESFPLGSTRMLKSVIVWFNSNDTFDNCHCIERVNQNVGYHEIRTVCSITKLNLVEYKIKYSTHP